MFETIRKVIDGHMVEFEPIILPCTYYHKDKQGECKNCHGTRKYVDGYYMIVENDGKKIAFTVDTIK